MNPSERIQQFASMVLRRGASELKDPDELVAACCLIIGSSFKEDISDAEVDAALARVVLAIKTATGSNGNKGVNN